MVRRLCYKRVSVAGQPGSTLLETVIALAIIGLLVPMTLTSLTTAVNGTDHAYDRSVLLEVAQSQMEEIQRQAYQESGNYALISVPPGYAVSISVSALATYVYPAPKLTATQQTAQRVTVSVTGVRGNLNLEANKVRR